MDKQEVFEKIEELKNLLLNKDWFQSDFAGWEGKLIDVLIDIVNSTPQLSGWNPVASAPASPTSPGKRGDYYIDAESENLFICVQDNKWLRTILTVWPAEDNFNNDFSQDFPN